MKRYSVIMAGGGGTRFWPLSRKAIPKQFLNLTGNDIMVNETIDRITGNVPKENIFIVTNEAHKEMIERETQGRLDAAHILGEPAARNTTACIGYAAMEIVRKYEDGIMCILPADHYIKNKTAYEEVMEAAILTAERTDKLITVGIAPDFPSTGYGYIKYHKTKNQIAYQVEEFVEKPDVDTARAYLKAGGYLWNSGMFIWKASTILKQIKELLPDVYGCLEEIGDAMGTEKEDEVLHKVYPVIPKISIDYGIMERSSGVLVLPGDFGWSDVGSWDALEALYPKDDKGNVTYGEQMLIDTRNCICYGSKDKNQKHKMIAAIGVEDLIMVQTEDAVLVCPKSRAQDVKSIVDKLQETGKEEFL